MSCMWINLLLDGRYMNFSILFGAGHLFFLQIYGSVCSFDEPFEEVVYPKGDPDAVSISKRDVDLLQPETFVNDTIIDFYIQ